MEFKLIALTDIWTGGVDPRNGDKLHLTGIKGSIRWWYEALIRGLGDYACDPSGNCKCTLVVKDFKNQISELKNRIKEEEVLDQALKNIGICRACRLFGCTNWSGKFILRVKDNEGQLINNQITKTCEFEIDLMEIKPFSPEEEIFINFTFGLIVKYGAIGGKTTLKPSEYNNKNNKRHHFDYGIIAWQSNHPSNAKPTRFPINSVLSKINEKEWPDLNYFWFAEGTYINRVTHNNIVKRDPNNPKKYLTNDLSYHWLGGEIKNQNNQSESKKIFSFHSINRCWGYTQRDQNKYDRLIDVLKNSGLKKIVSGKEMIKNGL